MMQQMMNRFARGSGIGMQREFNPLRSMRDPLGREWQGEDGTDTRRVNIPDQGAIASDIRVLLCTGRSLNWITSTGCFSGSDFRRLQGRPKRAGLLTCFENPFSRFTDLLKSERL